MPIMKPVKKKSRSKGALKPVVRKESSSSSSNPPTLLTDQQKSVVKKFIDYRISKNSGNAPVYSPPKVSTSNQSGDITKSYNLAPQSSSFASTSDVVRDEERRVQSDVARLSDVRSAYQPSSFESSINTILNSSQRSQELLNNRMAQLSELGRQEIAGINTQFDRAGEELRGAQESEGAQYRSTLNRIGGYLGASASAAGALVSLQSEHASQMESLNEKRAQAIRLANEGIAEGQFELAQAAVAEARQTEQAIMERQDTFFNQMMAKQQELRAQEQFEFQKYTDARDFAIDRFDSQLDMYVSSGQEMPMEDVISAAQVMGVSPKIIQGAVKAKQNTYRLAQKEALESRDIAILNALSSIPKGTYVEIGGKSYEGLGEVDMDGILEDLGLDGYTQITDTTTGLSFGVQEPNEDQQEVLSEFDSLRSSLFGLDDFATATNNTENGLGAWFMGAIDWAAGTTGANTDAKLFKEFKDSILSSLSKARGETGVLTDRDIDRVRGEIPRFGDSAEVTATKLEKIKGQLDVAEARYRLQNNLGNPVEMLQDMISGMVGDPTNPNSLGGAQFSHQEAVQELRSVNNRLSEAIGRSLQEGIKPTKILEDIYNGDAGPLFQTAGPQEVMSIIQSTAMQTGMDPAYMMALAERESSFKPDAKAKTSSASGLFQFVDGTWNEMVNKYGSATGVKKSDRNNPEAQAVMAALYARDNAKIVEQKTGKRLEGGENYVAHFLGAGGTTKILNNPNTSAASLLPEAAKANPTIFYQNGRALTGAELFASLAQDMERRTAKYSNTYA